jgi:two-component system chemotaxis response regulator CheB
MTTRDIVVIGGSTGSGAVLKEVLGGLPPTLPAAVLITTHMARDGPNYLIEMLQSASRMPVVRALDRHPVEPGRVYVASPDRHLLLVDGVVRLGDGPRENLSRPAVDPMFRSAALAHGSRVVGVILTGNMSDGAAGLHAIKARGGLAIVQHPLDCVADEMPRAALEAVDADRVERAADLAAAIVWGVATDAPESPPPSDDLLFEVEVAAGARLGSEALRRFADPAPLTCPECAGVLSQVRGGRPLRYRCQTGHAYTADILASHSEKIDEAVMIAMRVMEERVELIERMAKDAREAGRPAVAEVYEHRAEEYRHHAVTLREAAVLNARMRRIGEQPG